MIAFQSFAVGLAALVLEGWTRRRSAHLTPKDLTHTNVVTAKRWHQKKRPKVGSSWYPVALLLRVRQQYSVLAVITEPQRHAPGRMTYDLAFRNDGTLSDGRIVSARPAQVHRLGGPTAILARSYES